MAGTVNAAAIPVDEGVPSFPISINESPSEGAVEIAEGDTQIFNITGDRVFEAEWFIDGVSMKKEENVTYSLYSFEGHEPGNYSITAVATTSDRIIQKGWSLFVLPVYSPTGNLVWDENAGMSTTYVWNALSFSGFYYDLNSGTCSEELLINNIARSIDEGDICYIAKVIESDFEYGEWGAYEEFGFLGEKYIAGYTDETSLFVDEDISLIKHGILSRILIDEDDKKTVSSGSSLIFDEGYSLYIKEVDINENQVRIQLEKDGAVIVNESLSSNADFVYETEFGDVEDVPVILVHIGEIFNGQVTGAAFIEGIFQVSDCYIAIEAGNSFEEMEVTSVSSTGIKMENEDDISFDAGNTIKLMGNIMIRVADDSVLRFTPCLNLSKTGTYELRGTVFENEPSFTWTPLNFEGFFYNLDEGIGSENLTIEILDGRTIPENQLVYTSSIQPVEFECEEWGSYPVIGLAGLVGDKFIPLMSEGDDMRLASPDKLAKLLLDDGGAHNLSTGQRLQLGGGYALEVKQVDVEGDKVWLEFTKDGEFVDDEIIDISKSEYHFAHTWVVALDNVEDQDDIVVFQVYVDEIFQGTVNSTVRIKGLWLIDYTDILKIDLDAQFGELEVVEIGNGNTGPNPGYGWLEFRNDDPISLMKNSVQSISSEMKFKVADSESLRFYPFVMTTVNPPGPVDPPNPPVTNTYTIPLLKGWNLVSTPLIPENPGVYSIFGSNENVLLPVYTWNPGIRQYYTVENLEIGKGYWVLTLEDTNVTFKGTPYNG